MNRIKYGPPCGKNNHNWGGSSPETHRYHNVDGRMPYQRDKTFSVCSAAIIFIHIPIGSYSAADGSGPYDFEDAHHWFNRAVSGGIVFC